MRYTLGIVSTLLLILAAPFVLFAQESGRSDEEESFSRFRPSNELREKIDALGTVRAEEMKIPILMDVEVRDIYDSWGDPRGSGRSHEGIDILAPRGAFIVSPTDAVVSRTGVGSNGGNYVYTYNPGGERLYFAHLDAYAEGLKEGQVLKAGDLIGYVGNTGNASGGPPHLHLGIYNRGAQNPFPRLTKAFTDAERLDALQRIIESAPDPGKMTRAVIALYQNFLEKVEGRGMALPPPVLLVLVEERLIATAKRDLTLESKGDDVMLLQKFLIAKNTGPRAEALAGAGATGYFGPVTAAALAEYQAAHTIVPALGYFGAKTRAVLRGERASSIASTHASALVASKDLELGVRGAEVAALQQFLIETNAGPQAAALRETGATGYFGPATQSALAEFQKSEGIAPASGYFGAKTRAYLSSRVAAGQ